MRADPDLGTFMDELLSPENPFYQLAVFIAPAGGRRYLSDRVFEVQPGVFSEALVESWGELSLSASTSASAAGNGVPIKTCTLSILNFGPDWFSADYIRTGITGTRVELWQYVGGGSAPDPLLIDTFLVQDNISYGQGASTVNVDLVSELMGNDPYVGTLDPVTNEYYGISLGALSGVPGTLYGVNPVAKILADVAPGSSTIQTDRDLAGENFPTSGQVEIGVWLITYTGISADTFTGCTGVEITLPSGQFITLAGHDYVFACGAGPVDTAGPVFVDGVPYAGSYTIDTTSNPVTVTFPERLPNILTVNPSESVSGTLLQETPDAIFSFGSGEQLGGVYTEDGLYEGVWYSTGTPEDVQITFPGGLPSVVIHHDDVEESVIVERKYYIEDFEVFAGATIQYDSVFGGYRLYPPSGGNAGDLYARVPYTGITIPSDAYDINGFARTDMNIGYAEAVWTLAGDGPHSAHSATTAGGLYDVDSADDVSAGNNEFKVYALLDNLDPDVFILSEWIPSRPVVWISVFYKYISEPAYDEIKVYNSVDIYIDRHDSRDSFDSITLNIGDPSAGGANPADAILGVLSKNPTLATDSSSFDAARTWYDTNGYEFTGFIPGNQRMRKTLLDMCRQCRSMVYSRAGTVYLKVLGIDSSAPVQTYRSEAISTRYAVSKNSITVQDQQFSDIVNSLDVRYDASDVQAGYQHSFKVADSGSVTRYKLQDDTFDMYLVSDAAMASDVADYDLSTRAYLYTLVSFTTYLDAFPLEIYDQVALVTRYSKIVYFKGRVVNVQREFGSWKRKQMDRHKITIAGYYQDVYTMDLFDTLDIDEDVEVKNLEEAGWGNIGWGDDGWGV